MDKFSHILFIENLSGRRGRPKTTGFAKLARRTRTLAINFGNPSQKNMIPILVSHFKNTNNLKNSDAIRNKTEIKIPSKGNILFKLQKGAETRTENERKQNRELIKNYSKLLWP